jgi:hypothetical protein
VLALPAVRLELAERVCETLHTVDEDRSIPVKMIGEENRRSLAETDHRDAGALPIEGKDDAPAKDVAEVAHVRSDVAARGVQEVELAERHAYHDAAMAGSKVPGVAPDLLASYERLVATIPGLERKGAALPYTSVAGNMFSYLADGILVLRLGPDDRAAFIERYDTHIHEAYGRIQKEYVDVPRALLDDTAALSPWFAASYRYATGLRPKPTTRAGAQRD